MCRGLVRAHWQGRVLPEHRRFSSIVNQPQPNPPHYPSFILTPFNSMLVFTTSGLDHRAEWFTSRRGTTWCSQFRHGSLYFPWIRGCRLPPISVDLDRSSAIIFDRTVVMILGEIRSCDRIFHLGVTQCGRYHGGLRPYVCFEIKLVKPCILSDASLAPYSHCSVVDAPD